MINIILISGIAIIAFLGGGVQLFSKTTNADKTEKRKPNHLIDEKSPYLLQHAYNPVDWYPWGDTAISKARKENKPIILSIGYSTCHWCHVMEKESFQDLKIAEIMNQYFVCIKVDREERPDLDTIYMSAVTAINGFGGWPLNVFLTPDLKPFFGGTYFPAESKSQMTSWPDLLLRIANIWENPQERVKLIRSGDRLEQSLKTYLSRSQDFPKEFGFNSKPVELAFSHYSANYEQKFGGFSHAPKFPSPAVLNFLLTYYYHMKSGKNKAQQHGRALAMVNFTLRAMADGGIYDHLGGGFHRYATDTKWHIPHFEKMLYDNSQLIINYLEAYKITRDDHFKRIAEATADYIIRDMTHPEGGFYSAEDADSFPVNDPHNRDKMEGAFYIWERKEVENILDKAVSDIVAYYYGIKAEGNAENDPHGDFTKKNILFAAHSVKETARRFDLDENAVHDMLKDATARLLEARTERPRPHLDDKILTSWNGLMISALSKAYQLLGDEKYLIAAQNAARFINQNLYDSKTKQLFRRWRQGEKKIWAIAEDYAFLVQGLIDLYESDFNPKWLNWALELMELQVLGFYDKDRGGFFMTRKTHDQHLIIRIKEENDSVLPSANSVSVINLLRLSQFFDRKDLVGLAEETIAFFFNKMGQHPGAMPQMLVALEMALSKPVQVVIVWDKDSKNTKMMLNTVRSIFVPGMVVIGVGGDKTRRALARHLTVINSMKSITGLATAYVCSDFSCKEPTTDILRLKQMLEATAETSVSGTLMK